MLIKGQAFWAKIVGNPQPGYDKDELEWSIDVGQLDEATVAKLKKAGVRDSYFKNKGDERGTFLQLRRKALKAPKEKGGPQEAAKPIEIIDDHGNPWPNDKLIGNGSIINVAIGLNTVKWKGDKWLKPSIISVQVWDHKAYQPKGFPKKEAAETHEDSAKDQW